MPRTLDVLVPHYNDAAGLQLSLASIVQQTWAGEMRVVVADDGSSPQSIGELEKVIAASGLNVHLIKHDRNLGRPAARNTLLGAIESQYVAWLDSGDEWYPDKLEVQFAVLDRLKQTPGTGFHWVTCDYDWRWEGTEPKSVRQQVDERDQLRALLVGRNLRAYLWTLLGEAETFRKVGTFDEQLPRLQDLDYFIRFALKGGVLVRPPRNGAPERPLCVYHKSDIGRNALEIRRCNDHIFNKYRPIYERYGRTFVRGRLFEMDLLSARYASNNKDFALTLRFMLSAFARKPLSFARKSAREWLRRIRRRLTRPLPH